MKKLLLLITSLSSLTLPLISSRCKEETQEQKDEKLAKKYEKEYIDKQKYVFDDFEQFKMKDEHFKEVKPYKEIWHSRKIKSYFPTKKFFDDFNRWYDDFQWKFKIFKRVMNKYASKEIIEYKNPKIQENPINLYYVKEVKFDFSRGKDAQSYCIAQFRDDFKLIEKLFSIPNLNLNLSIELAGWEDLRNSKINKTYYSKINITSIFKYIYSRDKQKIKDIFSIPKPYYKNEHFKNYPVGEEIYQGKGDWKPRVKFESFWGINNPNNLLNLRYETSFDYGSNDIDKEYIEQYGNVNTFKFASYRFEIIEYSLNKPFTDPPSKVDRFTLSKHGD